MESLAIKFRKTGKRSREIAAELGVTEGLVCHWGAGRKLIRPERVIDVERVTGIPRHELRPDIYPPPDQASAA